MADIVGEKFRKLTPAQKAAERAKVAAQTPQLPSGPALEVAEHSPQAGESGTGRRTAGVAVRETPTPTLVASTSAFDPNLRGGGGLGAQAGAPTDPFTARTLEESADIINAQVDEEVAKADEVPTVDGPEEDVTEPTPLTPAQRITAINKELEAQTAQITSEPARQKKGEEIALLEQQARKEIKDVEAEQKLEDDERKKLGEDFKFEQLEEKIAGSREIAEKEGISLTAAAQRYDKRETAKADLDPEKTRIFDGIIDQITEPDFDSQDAYRVAIADYEKDGVDADDMDNANKAVASVFGQNFANEMQDDFLINDRKMDKAIVEGNRALIDAKKVGDTIKGGQAGAMVTNSYLKTVFDAAPELIPDAISQILASGATDDAKRQASAFGRDFFRDVETGIGGAGAKLNLRTVGNKILDFSSGSPVVLYEGEEGDDPLTIQQKFSNKLALKKDFDKQQIVVDTRDVRRKFGIIESAFKQIGFERGIEELDEASLAELDLPQGAKGSLIAIDQALITTFNKITDPSSVVRESEYARTSSDQAFVSKWIGFAEQLEQGGAGLTDNDRAAIVRMSKIFLEKSEEAFNEQRNVFFGEAEKTGLSPFFVVGELENQKQLEQETDTTPTQDIEITDEASAERALIDGGHVVTQANIDFLLSSQKKNNRGGTSVVDEPEFQSRLEEVAEDVGVTSDDLLKVIEVETAGTFDPSIQNPLGSASGIIQFTEATANNLGTTTEEIRNMTGTEQLNLVSRFLARNKDKINNRGDLYMAVFQPAALGEPDAFVIGSKGGKANAEHIASVNPAIAQGKKVITVADVRNFINNT